MGYPETAKLEAKQEVTDAFPMVARAGVESAAVAEPGHAWEPETPG